MQNLALLIIGWALGLLSTIFASLLIRYLALRQRPAQDPAEGVTDSDICRVLLRVVTPVATLALVGGFVLLLVTAPKTPSPVARPADGTQTAEAFQQRELAAEAQSTARRSAETAAAQATEMVLNADRTAVAAETELAREPSPTPEPPTSTPEPPTSTPQPATDTPTATDSPTPRPTRRPTTRPKPTKTPKPANPWKGEVRGKAPNCDYTQIEGLALDSAGGLVGNVWIHYWTDGWNGAWARSMPDSSPSSLGGSSAKNWDAFIIDYPRSGTWYTCVVAEKGSWDCTSNQVNVTTSAAPCGAGSSGVQIAYIVFQQN